MYIEWPLLVNVPQVVENKAFTSGSYKSAECVLADKTASIVVIAKNEQGEYIAPHERVGS